MLEVSEKEEGVVVLHLLIEPLKTHSGLEGRKEMFYLMTHSTHCIYSYMVSSIW